MLLWLVIVAIVSHKCVLVHWLLQFIPGDILCVSQFVIISYVIFNIMPFSCSTLSLEPFVVMSEFNVLEIVDNPSVEEFKNTKISKDDLKYILKSFGIAFNVDVRKDRLRSLILIQRKKLLELLPLKVVWILSIYSRQEKLRCKLYK